MVIVTLLNEHKQRLRSNRHEKCTKIHIKTWKWCARHVIGKIPDQDPEKNLLQLKHINAVPKIEEPSGLPMLCSTEYEVIDGESGGPLVQKLPSGKWTVVGIVSGSMADTSNEFLFSDYVSTAGHLHWIKSIIFQ